MKDEGEGVMFVILFVGLNCAIWIVIFALIKLADSAITTLAK